MNTQNENKNYYKVTNLGSFRKLSKLNDRRYRIPSWIRAGVFRAGYEDDSYDRICFSCFYHNEVCPNCMDGSIDIWSWNSVKKCANYFNIMEIQHKKYSDWIADSSVSQNVEVRMNTLCSHFAPRLEQIILRTHVEKIKKRGEAEEVLTHLMSSPLINIITNYV